MLPSSSLAQAGEGDKDDKALLVAGLERDPAKELALKAGFVSLGERVSQWTRQASMSPPSSARAAATDSSDRGEFVEAFKEEHLRRRQGAELTAPQFATLHEFFQSKTSLKQQLAQEELLRRERRPKMPVMKLSKEDWNVKCWEERFKPLGVRRREQLQRAGGPVNKENSSGKQQQQQQQQNSTASEKCEPNRVRKPERQVEVFNGRIDEVARKLEKMREGAPMDELVYKLERGRLAPQGREHSWTDMLKGELNRGAHKALPSGGQPKWPLGRPIGRICGDDDDEDD